MATKKKLSTPKKSTQKTTSPVSPTRPAASAGFWQVLWYHLTKWAVQHKFWQRLGLGLVALVVLAVGSMYGIAQWYIHEHANEPLTIGATFIPDYARYFDEDPQETLSAIITDLGVKKLRLVSYWENGESTRGTYDFTELDWQFRMAEATGAKVSLAIGLRQPRWPECHMPDWANKMPGDTWEQPLYNYMTAVVNRYKDSPALDSYQLENEYFLKVFGVCTNFDRDRLTAEYNMVKGLDSKHPVIVSMSNNAIGTPIGKPTPDAWGISIYKRVWDKTITKRYFEYPIPTWYYAFRAGFTELTRHRPVFIHELQTEAWTPDDTGGTKEASLAEQDKSLDAQRLDDRINYGEATGMKEVYLWGVEWWYWRLTQKDDPSLWNTAKAKLQQIDQSNQTKTGSTFNETILESMSKH